MNYCCNSGTAASSLTRTGMRPNDPLSTFLTINLHQVVMLPTLAPTEPKSAEWIEHD